MRKEIERVEKIADAYSSTIEHKTGGDAPTERNLLSDRQQFFSNDEENRKEIGAKADMSLVQSIMESIQVTQSVFMR